MWGAIAGAALSGLGGLLGSKGGSSGGVYTYDPFKEYREGMQPLWQQNQAYVGDTLSRAQSGRAPAYFENAIPGLRSEAQKNIRQTYYGMPGYRNEGLYNQAVQEGALTGVGPKATLARTQRVKSDYSNQMAALEDMIMRTQLDTIGQNAQWASGQVPSMMGQVNYPGQMVPYQQTSQPSGIGSFLGAAGGMLGSMDTYNGTNTWGGSGGGNQGYLGTMGQYNMPGTGLFGSRVGGMTQSEILGTSTGQWRSSR